MNPSFFGAKACVSFSVVATPQRNDPSGLSVPRLDIMPGGLVPMTYLLGCFAMFYNQSRRPIVHAIMKCLISKFTSERDRRMNGAPFS